MACDHRYQVQADDSGKGMIKCRRCGDVRADGLPMQSDMEAIRDRLKWEARKAGSPLILPRGL